MKKLLVLRHAHAAAMPGAPDHERPLDPRGLREAHALGAALTRRGTVLDAVVSSTAVRARSTALAVLEGAGLPPSLIRLEPAVYEASAGTLLRIVGAFGDDAATVLLVGHNPGLEELLLRLTGDPVGLVPCTLVALDLPVSTWTEAAAGAASVAWRRVPGGF